ncbi:MAG: hypothetical protein QW416_05495 [Candidatus Nitrosocaldaceae archaeon]
MSTSEIGMIGEFEREVQVIKYDLEMRFIAEFLLDADYRVEPS